MNKNIFAVSVLSATMLLAACDGKDGTERHRRQLTVQTASIRWLLPATSRLVTQYALAAVLRWTAVWIRTATMFWMPAK